MSDFHEAVKFGKRYRYKPLQGKLLLYFVLFEYMGSLLTAWYSHFPLSLASIIYWGIATWGVWTLYRVNVFDVPEWAKNWDEPLTQAEIDELVAGLQQANGSIKVIKEKTDNIKQLLAGDDNEKRDA